MSLVNGIIKWIVVNGNLSGWLVIGSFFYKRIEKYVESDSFIDKEALTICRINAV